MKENQHYIHTFDALRGIASILIFLNHCTFMNNASITGYVFEHLFHNGTFEVTFFFVLSGFCTERKYGQTFNKPIHPKACFSFAVSKAKKFYVLYVLTMIYVFLYNVLIYHESLIKEGFFLLLSLSMLQTFTIKFDLILNSAAWFLSALIILYFLFPFLSKVLKRIKHSYFLIVCGLFYVGVNFISIRLLALDIISYATYNSLTHTFPFYWIPAFFVGMLLAKLSSDNTFPQCDSKAEVTAICFAASVYLLCLNIPGDVVTIFTHFFYVASAAGVIYVFSQEQGKISAFLMNSKFGVLGHYSLEIYLIHYPLIYFGGAALLSSIPDTNITIVIKTMILFCTTLILALLVKKIQLLAKSYRTKI